MNLIEEIKEKTGIDITKKSRIQETVYSRAVYYKISRDNNIFTSLQRLGDTCNQSHCQVLHSIRNVFPTAIKYSKHHRELYYELLGIVDPEIQKEKDNALERLKMDSRIRKSLVRELLSEYNFFIKPHHKRQLEDLL